MEEAFKIYIEQLRDGHIEKIQETFSPEFLDVHEQGLSFVDPVVLNGEAYLAEDNLVLHFNILAQAVTLCSICNAPVKTKIQIEGCYHTEPLAGIKGGIFNFKDALREMILLEAPEFAECEENCPRRKEIAHYLKKTEKGQSKIGDEEGYHPFADLNWEEPKKKRKK